MLRPAFLAAIHKALVRYDTPFYVYDLEKIEGNVQRLKQAFPSARIFYALKANPRLGILRRLAGLGLGVEAVSLGEVKRAYQAGFTPDQVVMNGPVKTPGMLEALKVLGVPHLVLDSPGDAERVNRVLPGSRVLIRVNPDLPVDTHRHLATGRGDSQFGVLPEDLAETLAAAPDLEVLGLHLHLGSGLVHPEAFLAGYRLLAELSAAFGPFDILDLGGGFGPGLDLGALAAAANELGRVTGASLWLEPGRFLVSESGVFLTRIWGIKRTRRNYLLVDAGMTTLLRPMLYGAAYEILPLYQGGALSRYDLAGSACEAGDVLVRDVLLPKPNDGDALAILEAGAYGSSMHLAYLDHPWPLELLFTENGLELLRRPQYDNELWLGES